MFIKLLGVPNVTYGKPSQRLELHRQAMLVLSFLALNSQLSASRKVLTDKLWPHSADNGPRQLSSALHRLRKELEPVGGELVRSTLAGDIYLAEDASVRIDVVEFGRIAEWLFPTTGVLSDRDQQDLRNALSLYEGPLMFGHEYDWMLAQRQELSSLYVLSDVSAPGTDWAD